MSQLTLGGIAEHVRTAMDLDSTELPDSLFQYWAREISQRIRFAHKRWPFLESDWSFTTTEDVASYSFSDISESGNTLKNPVSVIDSSSVPVKWIGYEEAEANYYAANVPAGRKYYTIWNNSIVLYPTPSAAETFTVRGYRGPNDWVADGSGGVPDFPDEFDQVITNWCLGRAYWQQEDPEMGQPLMDLADSELRELVARYPDEPAAQPLVIGGRSRRHVIGRMVYDWEQ